jgi:hypothetical protein
MCMCLVRMFIKIDLFESPDLTSLNFCLCGCMKSEVCTRNLDARDELFACILDAPACIKKREEQLRRTIRDLCTLFAKWLMVGLSNIYYEM